MHAHVLPRRGRTEIVGRHGDALKIRVAAPPVDGRANTACAELVAEVLGVRPADVELVSGRTSRAKRFRVRGVDAARASAALDRALRSPDPRAGHRR